MLCLHICLWSPISSPTMYLSCGAFFLRKKEESSTLRVYLLIEAIMFFELIKVPVSPHGFGGLYLPLPARNGHRKKMGKIGWFLFVQIDDSKSEKSFQTNQWAFENTTKPGSGWLKNVAFHVTRFWIFWAKKMAALYRLQPIPFL